MTSPLPPRHQVLASTFDAPAGETKRAPLDLQETALLGVTALHLCFLPWALGTMHVWSQFTSLGCATAGFILALLPRTAGGGFSDVPRTRQWPAAQLLRSPVFWAAWAFLGYIALQGFNPAWRFFENENSWWLEPLDPITWLPSSVAAPFGRSNPWRALVIFGTLTLLLGSVWTGFRRRKSYYILFALLATNAGLLAVFGLVQRVSGATQIFWSYTSINSNFVASFIYPNHAGPYLNLMVALAIGLAWWHDQRARKRLESPGRATCFLLVGLGCGSLVIFTYSRMSIALLILLTGFVGGSLLFRLFQRPGPVHQRPEFFYLALALMAFLGIGLVTLRTDKARARLAALIADPTAAVIDRTLARQAAGDMLRDHWLFGWGAGCFRYGFSKYTQKYPVIHYFPHGPRRYWEHAHDDLLEFPIEFGVVGLVPLVGVLGYSVWQLFRRRFWRNVVSLSLVLGCALIVLHAWVDFVFQNPAVLLTWSVLLVGALRWAELDQPHRRPQLINPRTGYIPAPGVSSPA